MQRKTKTFILILASIFSLLLFFTGCSSNSNKDNHEHSWTIYVVREVSCSEDGILERICTCGKKDYVSVPKNDHNRNSNGECIICGDGKKEEAHEHSYVWTTILEPTCENKGIDKGTCACGHETIKDIEAKGHDRNTDGECIICGAGKKEEAHEHSYVWTTIVEPTCKDKGMKKGVCECGQINLFYIDEELTHKSDRQGVCSSCGDVINSYIGEGFSVQTILDLSAKFGYEITNREVIYYAERYKFYDIKIGALNCFYLSVGIDGQYEITNLPIGDISVNYQIEIPDGLAYVERLFISKGKLNVVLADGTQDDYGETVLSTQNKNSVRALLVNKENILMVVYNDNSVKIAGKIAKTDEDTSGGELIYRKVNEEYYVGGLLNNNLSEVVIPLTHRGKPVVGIDDGAFYKNQKLTKVVIGNNVKTIGDSAFYNCENLKTLVIGNSVENIKLWAFYDCDSLTSIEIPNSVTRIGDYAFYDCDSLTSVVIPNSVTSIGRAAFRYCTSLTSIKYRGTQTQWSAITKGSWWSYNTGNYTITYNYKGE